jgi:hypothetical protein
MILYHFTCYEHMESILRDGLNRGDVPTRLLGPLSETNAVWLTTQQDPQGCGLSVSSHVLTEAERQEHFEAVGVMPPEGARYADKTAVRIKVMIPSTDRCLKRWLTFGRKHCEPGLYDILVRADGHSHKSWWLYFGTIAPSQFQAVDYLKAEA